MLELGDSEGQKVKFEISAFEIGYRQNFVKIKKLILFDKKCSYPGICSKNFQNQCQT